MHVISPPMLSTFCPPSITIAAAAKTSPGLLYISSSDYMKSIPCMCLKYSIIASLDTKEEPKLKWTDVGSNVSEAHKHAISKLPLKMTNRCKALMRRIICFSPEDESLHLILASWVKVMKPRRADWLSVLKEMKRIDSPLLLEVMEYALLEDSFEAYVRDYTKLIHMYGKLNRLQSAENALRTMKSRGFPCDQVILTVLIDVYSKARDVNRAKETFEEIKLLGLELDKRAYGSMVMAYIRADMLDQAERLIKEMEAQETYAGKEIYKALLRAFSMAGDYNGAQRIFDAVQFAGIVPDSKFCALLVNAYCLAGRSDGARSVVENMKSVGLRPCNRSVALIISTYEKENSLEKALGFLIELEEDGIVIAPEASQVMVGWLHRLGVGDGIEQFLLEFQKDKGRAMVRRNSP